LHGGNNLLHQHACPPARQTCPTCSRVAKLRDFWFYGVAFSFSSFSQAAQTKQLVIILLFNIFLYLVYLVIFCYSVSVIRQ
jgi:hypothetical protein